MWLKIRVTGERAMCLGHCKHASPVHIQVYGREKSSWLLQVRRDDREFSIQRGLTYSVNPQSSWLMDSVFANSAIC